MIEKQHCIVCGMPYDVFTESKYRPLTCLNVECIYRFLHDKKYEEKRKEQWTKHFQFSHDRT